MLKIFLLCIIFSSRNNNGVPHIATSTSNSNIRVIPATGVSMQHNTDNMTITIEVSDAVFSVWKKWILPSFGKEFYSSPPAPINSLGTTYYLLLFLDLRFDEISSSLEWIFTRHNEYVYRIELDHFRPHYGVKGHFSCIKAKKDSKKKKYELKIEKCILWDSINSFFL